MKKSERKIVIPDFHAPGEHTLRRPIRLEKGR